MTSISASLMKTGRRCDMEAVSAERVHVGVAGWNYPDWRDIVYKLPPEPQQQPSLFEEKQAKKTSYARDELTYLSGFVDMIEINTSFYGIPKAKTTAGWAERIACRNRFFFTAKLYQEFTHGHLQDKNLAQEFRAAFKPLRLSKRLKGFLVQFRYDFDDNPPARQLLRWINSEFAEFAPLIFEVRHKSWESEHAIDFFRELNVSVANLDYPKASNSFNPYALTLTPHAYFRLHGRNRKAWFSKDAGVAETYNYDYTDHEIQQLAQRARRILTGVKELTIVANNHYRGKAVSTALRLKAELTQQKTPIPPALLETYPELKRIRL